MDIEAEYHQGWKISDAIPTNSTGVITARDKFVVDFDQSELAKRVSLLRDPATAQRTIETFELADTREIPLAESLRMLKEIDDVRTYIQRILYRPFDERHIFYHQALVRWPVVQMMRHMLSGKNLGLATTRSTEIGRGWEHLFCTRDIIQVHTVSLKEVNYLFPLYLYPDPAKPNLWDTDEPSSAPGGRRPNLAPAFIRDFSARLGLAWVSDGGGDRDAGTFGPEDVFDYLYAVFHAPEYRERCAEFLKTDFPRLPLASDAALFWSLRDLGAQLVALHLMERAATIPAITRYPIPGDNVVEKVWYVAAPPSPPSPLP